MAITPISQPPLYTDPQEVFPKPSNAEEHFQQSTTCYPAQDTLSSEDTKNPAPSTETDEGWLAGILSTTKRFLGIDKAPAKEVEQAPQTDSNISCGGSQTGWIDNSLPKLESPKFDADPEALINFLHYLQHNQLTDSGRFNKDLIEINRAERKNHHQERQEQLKKLIKKNKNSQRWGYFQKALSGIGLVVAAGSGIATGGASTLLIAAWAVGGTLLVDQLTGDHGKEELSKFLADIADEGDPETQQQIQSYLNMICGLAMAGIGLFSGSAVGGVHKAINVATNLTQGTSESAKAIHDHSKNAIQSGSAVSQTMIEKNGHRLKELTAIHKELLESLRELHSNMATTRERARQATSNILA
ncbi:MAG: hypothetical protein ACQEP8_05960 [Chlamydiota bacterium]